MEVFCYPEKKCLGLSPCIQLVLLKWKKTINSIFYFTIALELKAYLALVLQSRVILYSN